MQIVAIPNKFRIDFSSALCRLPVRGLGPMLPVFLRLTMSRLTEFLLVSVKTAFFHYVLPR